MSNAWITYAGDFNSMTDKEIANECDNCRVLIEENESWLEGVASWKAAGKPKKDQP